MALSLEQYRARCGARYDVRARASVPIRRRLAARLWHQASYAYQDARVRRECWGKLPSGEFWLSGPRHILAQIGCESIQEG